MCLILSSSLAFAQTAVKKTETKKKKKTAVKTSVKTSVKAIDQTKTTVAPAPTAAPVKKESKNKTLKDYFGINYFGVINGPSVSQISHGELHNRRTNLAGEDTGAYLRWDHQFSFLGRKVLGNMDYVANVRIRTQKDPANEVVGRDFRTGFQGMLYQGKKDGLWGRFDVDLPTSTGSKIDGMIVSPGWLIDYFYSATSNLTLGLNHFLKIGFFEKSTIADGSNTDNFFQWVAPYFTYKINDKWDITTYYNNDLNNKMENNNYLHFRRSVESLQIGANYRFASGWTIYPTVILDLNRNVETDNTNLMYMQIWLFGPLF
jgi:hypothetical protein